MLFINLHRRIVTVIITAYKKQSELGKFKKKKNFFRIKSHYANKKLSVHFI